MAKEDCEVNGLNAQSKGYTKSGQERTIMRKKKKEKQLMKTKDEHEEEEVNKMDCTEKSNDETIDRLKKKRKKKLLKEAAMADKRGVCYLSRIPPHMDHVNLHHILSQYGEIQRIYLAPQGPPAQAHRKRP